jgi:hypothetical protein
MTDSRGFLIHWSGVRIPSGAPRLGITAAESCATDRPQCPACECESVPVGTQAGHHLGAEAKVRTAVATVTSPSGVVAGANPARSTSYPAAWSLAFAAERLGLGAL